MSELLFGAKVRRPASKIYLMPILGVFLSYVKCPKAPKCGKLCAHTRTLNLDDYQGLETALRYREKACAFTRQLYQV
jgi:hypothetical protein